MKHHRIRLSTRSQSLVLGISHSSGVDRNGQRVKKGSCPMGQSRMICRQLRSAVPSAQNPRAPPRSSPTPSCPTRPTEKYGKECSQVAGASQRPISGKPDPAFPLSCGTSWLSVAMETRCLLSSVLYQESSLGTPWLRESPLTPLAPRVGK